MPDGTGRGPPDLSSGWCSRKPQPPPCWQLVVRRRTSECLSALARREMLHSRPARPVANGKSGVPRTVDPARTPPTGHEEMGIRQSWGNAGGQAESVAMARGSSSLRPGALGLEDQLRNRKQSPWLPQSSAVDDHRSVRMRGQHARDLLVVRFRDAGWDALSPHWKGLWHRRLGKGA